MLAVELEVMAKKMDRFGWERDRGSMAHDRIMTDWMDGLQDYPLGEVQEACRKWVREAPRKMPNEGDILSIIKRERARLWELRKATQPVSEPEPEREARVSPKAAADIVKRAGFAPRKFGGGNG